MPPGHGWRREGLLDHVRLLPCVLLRRSWGGTRATRAAGIAERMLCAQHRLQMSAHETPRAHVARLLLHPNYMLGVGISPQNLGDFGFGIWVEQLQPNNRGIHCFARIARREQLIVDLARA